MTIPNCQNMYVQLGFLVNDKVVTNDLDANVLNICPLAYFRMQRNQLYSLIKKLVELSAVRFVFVSVNPVFQYLLSIRVCSV